MSEMRQQVLQMLREGKITADEALDLLNALADETSQTAEKSPTTAVDRSLPPDPYPDMDRFRQYWRLPFAIGLFILLLVGLWLRTLYQNANGAFTLGMFCVTTFLIFTLSLTLLALASRRATWLHVRVQEQSGTRISVSLPLPLPLARWAIRIGRGFVPKEVAEQLAIVDAFLETAADELRGPDAEPITIQVDEGDGDRVLVYFG